MMHSSIYRGWLEHRRMAPRRHTFRYRLFMLYLDLSELDQVFAGRWLWSVRRPALARFDRRDHLGDPAIPLDQAVRDLVAERTGTRPLGPIRLLTHLRYFGHVFNPVSFYYCFDAHDRRVETVVAEVHNTPWGERHCYVLACPGDSAANTFAFRKAFHVSPFMPMAIDYRWRLTDPGDRVTVHMVNLEAGQAIFDATLTLARRPITGGNLARVLLVYPFMTLQVIAGLYWQALRLRWKGTPYHPHPRHAERRDAHTYVPETPR